MKFLLLFPFVLIIAGLHPVKAQHTCCQPPATQQFAIMAQQDAFKGAHLSPLPYQHNSAIGRDTTFPINGQKAGHAYFLPASKPSKKYVFVIHEWWGLNDYIKKESEKLWKDLGDVNVLALDLYDYQLATTPDSAATYMARVSVARAEAIIKGALAFAGPEARVAAIGWCFGGGWSLQAAILSGKQAAGCVMYYGMPEKSQEKLKTLKTDVLGIFATRDQWINASVVSGFEADMKKAGKQLTLKTFEADHAFANPSNPKFDLTAAAAAYTLSLDYLKKHLQ